MRQLTNAHLTVAVSEAGELQSIQNHLCGEIYDYTSDRVALHTDQGVFSNQAVSPVRVNCAQDSLTYHFEFAPINIVLTYTLEADTGFVRRSLKIQNCAPLRLLSVVLGESVFSCPAEEAIHYLTFWMAPTVEFIRYAKGGLFTGIENPFYQASISKQGVTLSYEPGLILQAEEGYESEPQFIGVYKKSGVMIEDSGRPFRYPNGSAYIPIDLNESRAMRAFALDYLRPIQHSFLIINYQFFHPLPQLPSTEADKWYFSKTIDTFADIGGDMIIFKPLHRHRKPDATTAYWNVLPDDPNAIPKQIAAYARQKGILYGFYLGIAGGHGEEGNSAGLPFRPEEIRWKKMDAEGRRAPDNCMACDDFFEWWLQVHDNTIKRYQLSNWSWDPNVGSAMNCYDESHGHIAGKGAYKGWRRCIELAHQLKERNPGLFIQGFYGTKQFGLWGLKYTDQHEVYNEQTAIVCTHHTQISDDRQNADGLRFQNYWSMRFRFLPTVIGHALVHRMSEGEFDPDLIKAWDFDGWRYSVMSALAVSGSVIPSILPVDSDLVPGFAEFYRKWSGWAKTNFDYVHYTEPFGEQVQPGCIDGYARIKGDHGFIFLFNGNPRPATITFEVGDEINLQQAGEYSLVELYPTEGAAVVDDHAHRIFALGESASLTLPSNSCKLIELHRVNARAEVHVNKTAQATPDPTHLDIAAPATTYTEVLDCKGFPRELDDWRLTDGMPFVFPFHDQQTSLTIHTNFLISPEVVDMLRSARPRNFDEMSATIAAWQASDKVDYSYHNFIGSRPDRLWFVIPFVLQKPSAHAFASDFSIAVVVNDSNVSEQVKCDANGNSFLVDITDHLRFGLVPEATNIISLSLSHVGPNEFMGPFLVYPQEKLSQDQIDYSSVNVHLHATNGANQPIVYTRPLTVPTMPRYVKGAQSPRITDASVAGNVTLSRSTQLRVRIDRPPNAVRQVSYTHSGFPWMGIVPLTYDPAQDCWVAEVMPGPRQAIPESEFVYCWAIGIDGLHSDYFPVRVGWDFCE